MPISVSTQPIMQHDNHRPDRIDAMQEQRAQAAGGGRQIYGQHGLRLGQPQIDEPVRKMVLVGLERAVAGPQSDQDHGRHVVQRHRQHAQRGQDRVPMVPLVAGVRREQRRHGDHEADEIGPSVPHEDFGRRPIVPEEAEYSADQHQQ